MENRKNSRKIYFIILALSALAAGMSNGVLSNYFKDAYDVTAYQRGLIEFPRETPGMIAILIIASLSFLSDIRIMVIAQILGFIGIATLGLFTLEFNIMLIFIFINSVGMHMSMPLRDSIGLSLMDSKKIGKKMGQYKGVTTAFTMVASLIVFIGFRTGIFSFTTKFKLIFIISGVLSLVVLILYLYLGKSMKQKVKSDKRFKFVYRKDYKYYYVLTIMFGVQKQIMMVYGPWVLIDLLNKKADTLAILGIIGSFVGMFFIPALGKWIDKFGIKKLLYVDALSFIFVYIVYGILSSGFATGKLSLMGLPVFVAYGLFIVDKMSNQMGMIRTLYLRSILVELDDLTPTLSLGLSLDHFVSIICAYLGGVIWIAWGPQYIFFLAAALSFVNLFVARKVVIPEDMK